MDGTVYEPRWRRLIDGGHSWGSLTISPTRHGVTRYRLVLFPPGISSDERMMLRLWRSWPIWGTIAWLALDGLLASTIGPGPALATATLAWLGVGGLVMAMASTSRTHVRTMTVVRIAGFHHPATATAYAELNALATGLLSADRRLADGDLSTVGHEAEVWCSYDRMAPSATGDARSDVRPE